MILCCLLQVELYMISRRWTFRHTSAGCNKSWYHLSFEPPQPYASSTLTAFTVTSGGRHPSHTFCLKMQLAKPSLASAWLVAS